MATRATAPVTESLGAVPLFSGCSQQELSKLARLGTLVHVAQGAVLTEEDKPGRGSSCSWMARLTARSRGGT